VLPNYILKQLLELLRVISALQRSQICRSKQKQWDISLKDEEKGRVGALQEQVSRAFPELSRQACSAGG